MLVFGEEMQNCNKAILGFATLLTEPGAEMGILSVKTTPLNNCMSSRVPPNFWCIFMFFKSKLLAVLISQMLLTASKAIGASSVEF